MEAIGTSLLEKGYPYLIEYPSEHPFPGEKVYLSIGEKMYRDC
jgi:hypothetical protein